MTIPIDSLIVLPEEAGYFAESGNVRVKVTRKGKGLDIAARSDSITVDNLEIQEQMLKMEHEKTSASKDVEPQKTTFHSTLKRSLISFLIGLIIGISIIPAIRIIKKIK